MATKQRLSRIFSTMAAAYGKPPAWSDDQVQAALKVLGQAEDDDIEVALAAWLDDHPDRPPVLAELRATLRSRRTATAGAVPGCGACSPEGLREVAIHRSPLNPRPDGATVEVLVVACHCDCARGEWWAHRRTQPLKDGDGQARPRPPHLREVVAGARAKPRTLAVYADPTADQRVPPGPDAPVRYRGTSLAEAAGILAGHDNSTRAARRPIPTRTLQAVADERAKAYAEQRGTAPTGADEPPPYRDEDRFDVLPEDDEGVPW